MDKTSLGFQKPKDEEYYDINIFNQNAQLANDLIEKNSSAIGQKLDKNSSFYADLEAYYGNTKLIDDFQDISKWTSLTGVQSSDTINIKVGNQSLKIVENDNSSSFLISTMQNISLDLDTLNNGEVSTNDDYINLALYISDITKVNMSNGIILYFGQDSLDPTINNKYKVINTGLITGWNFLKIKKSNFSTNGTGLWNEIKSVRVLWQSTTNAQNAYVSFQLIQLVKADPDTLLDRPNPFQKFGVKDFEINSGEWYVEKEFNSLICKELSGVNATIRSLNSVFRLKDFQAEIITSKSGNDCWIGGIYGNSSNYLGIRSLGSIVYLYKRVNGVDTSQKFTLPDSEIVVRIIKKENKISFFINGISKNITFEYDGTCELIIGSNNPETAYFKSSSITEISHAHHSDVSEVAKKLSIHPYSNPNLLINGDFQIWQRGTSALGVGYKTADRWYISTVAPFDNLSSLGYSYGIGNFLRLSSTVSQGSGNNIRQRLEVDMLKRLAGKKVTLSFYSRDSIKGDGIVYLRQHFGVGGSPQVDRTVLLTHDINWSKKTIIFDVPSIEGKVLGEGPWIEIIITTNLSNVAHNLDVAQVKLELGEIATPLAPRSYGEELALCQRYYNIFYVRPVYYSVGAGAGYQTEYSLIVPCMRVTPTVTHKIIDGSKLNVYNSAVVARNEKTVDYTILSNNVGLCYAQLEIKLDAEIY